MGNFLKDLVKSEPHSIEYIRESLDLMLDDEGDLIPILKDHHDFLDESISVLVDSDADEMNKQKNLIRFFRLFEMHAKAEQETLYMHLKHNEEKEARLEGFAGKDEHDVVFQIQEELLEMGYLSRWDEEIAAKAKVAASLVKNHLKEEENFMFPIARTNLKKSELQSMRIQYLEKCRLYLDEVEVDSYESWDTLPRSSVTGFRDVF